jgi:hypothetical protein
VAAGSTPLASNGGAQSRFDPVARHGDERPVGFAHAQDVQVARCSAFEPFAHQAGAGPGRRQGVDEFGGIHKSQIGSPRQVELRNAGDAIVDPGAGAQFGTCQRSDLADGQSQRMIRENRIDPSVRFGPCLERGICGSKPGVSLQKPKQRHCLSAEPRINALAASGRRNATLLRRQSPCPNRTEGAAPVQMTAKAQRLEHDRMVRGDN